MSLLIVGAEAESEGCYCGQQRKPHVAERYRFPKLHVAVAHYVTPCCCASARRRHRQRHRHAATAATRAQVKAGAADVQDPESKFQQSERKAG